MSDEGWSVRDAAARLLCSEATIRRRIRPGTGDLAAVAGVRPLRVTVESLEEAQADMLRQMGVSAEVRPPPRGSSEARVRELEMENLLLRGALEDLTAANAAMLDTFRRLGSAATPNN